MNDSKTRQPRKPRGPRKPILLLAGLFLVGLCTPTARAEVVEEIIAHVNERVIVLSEYRRSLESLREELRQEAKSGLEMEGLFQQRSKDSLRDLIDHQLLVQKASDLGISVETDVVRRLDDIRQQMNLPSLEALEEAVEQQNINFEDFRQNLRDGFLSQRVIGREVGSRVQVTPEEISAYYEQHKQELERTEGVYIQQILISTEGKSEPEVESLREKAAEVLAKARSGEDFAGLARQYSDDATASSGGDAGFFERGSMVPEIETVAYSLQKNQVSDVIQTRFGFLIIKVLEQTQAGTPPLAQVENQIHERLYLEKIQPALREYLARLREESFLQIKPGYADTGAVAQQASAEKP